MKQSRFLFSILLATILVAAGYGAARGQQKIGISGAVEQDKKGKQKIGTSSAVVNNEEVKAPPPPPPSKSSLAIATNAPNADVIINGSRRFKTDESGAVRQGIILSPGTVSIVVRHPDFEEVKDTIVLKVGESKLEPISLVSKYGDLKLGGIPEKAQVFIDDVERTADLERNGEEVSLYRIAVGTRKLKIVHPDYITREDNIEIKPGEELADAKGLELALAELTVNSLAGATVYVNGVARGKVLPEGKIVVAAIKPGDCDIRVVKDGFIEWKKSEKLGVGPKTMEAKLLPIPNSVQFDEYFNSGLTRWNAPAAWTVEKAALIVRGDANLGFPKDRNYRDFDAQFSVKMLNGQGAAWALHIEGEGKKYYLFYMAGPQSKFKGSFRTYVVKDGKYDINTYQDSVPTDIIKLTATDLYTIRVKVRGNKFETFIKPETGPDAGNELPIGVYVDEENNMTYGNFGFCALDGDETQFDDFHILPIENAEEKSTEKR
jgi:hypothetical protein